MKLNLRNNKSSAPAGMTLVEMSVVLAVALSLIGLVFLGARAWKSGSDRAACVMNISQVQKAVRAYSTARGYEPGLVVGGGSSGSRWRSATPTGSESNFLLAKITGEGNYLESKPECDGGGIYDTLEDRVPRMGQLYMTCSLSRDLLHLPKDSQGW